MKRLIAIALLLFSGTASALKWHYGAEPTIEWDPAQHTITEEERIAYKVAFVEYGQGDPTMSWSEAITATQKTITLPSAGLYVVGVRTVIQRNDPTDGWVDVGSSDTAWSYSEEATNGAPFGIRYVGVVPVPTGLGPR